MHGIQVTVGQRLTLVQPDDEMSLQPTDGGVNQCCTVPCRYLIGEHVLIYVRSFRIRKYHDIFDIYISAIFDSCKILPLYK